MITKAKERGFIVTLDNPRDWTYRAAEFPVAICQGEAEPQLGVSRAGAGHGGGAARLGRLQRDNV